MFKIFAKIKSICYILMVAWMLGISNIILEETRMVHDTRAVIEQQEEIPDTNFDSDDLIL